MADEVGVGVLSSDSRSLGGKPMLSCESDVVMWCRSSRLWRWASFGGGSLKQTRRVDMLKRWIQGVRVMELGPRKGGCSLG